MVMYRASSVVEARVAFVKILLRVFQNAYYLLGSSPIVREGSVAEPNQHFLFPRTAIFLMQVALARKKYLRISSLLKSGKSDVNPDHGFHW